MLWRFLVIVFTSLLCCLTVPLHLSHASEKPVFTVGIVPQQAAAKLARS